MPGIVIFNRRWSVGSDDLVVPGLFLFTMHLIWITALGLLLGLVEFEEDFCEFLLWCYFLSYLVFLLVALVNELAISIVALRGSILDPEPRRSMKYLLYIRLGLILVETILLITGIVWIVNYYTECPIDRGKQVVLGLVVCNWCILVSILVTVWCTYDSAGRSWVKMKKYQRSMRESESKFQYKRSGSTRNWRQRKVLRAYQDSWHQRCRFLFCCMRPSDRNRNSFADIARLLSDFFRDLDVVPSDVVAGLVLLRKFQKIERKAIIEQRKNDTYEFLSGAAVTPRTQFLSLHEGQDLELFQTIIHFAHFAVRAYGWPIYVMTQNMGLCQICANLRCCCFPCRKTNYDVEIVEDNCCKCNFAALEKLLELGNIEIIYATYHVDVGETPFFVALDYDRKNIVVSIRGTLSMKDILTDLNAEGETLPVTPVQEDWLGHKGMVQAAQYILDKLKSEQLIERALHRSPENGTMAFQLVCVGHSLGAGTASILSILLRQEYPDLLCYCYSPPGGLLSMPAVEYTKAFTISVVLGKDVVPRIGLHQMEALRADLINAINRSVDPKWKTIACSVMCCGCGSEPTSAVEMSEGDATVTEYMKSRDFARVQKVHPSDSSIALTSHQPLYPPGRIIHVVRHHPTKGEQALSTKEPVYQALWAQNVDFDEVLISPVMIQDHMPDKVLDALTKVVTHLGPRKPQRIPSQPQHQQLQLQQQQQNCCLETSFTSLPGSPLDAISPINGISESSTMVATFMKSLGKKPYPKKTMSLDIPAVSQPTKLDLIHDDWFGLAPLASPESMSEISSISSRASFHEITRERLGSFELKTPKVMRRTPKINNNLSTCADDIKNVQYYQRLGQLSKHLLQDNVSSNRSSNLSLESPKKDTPSIQYQSVEDILDSVMESAGCADFFNSKTTFLETHFDESVVGATDDPDVLSNFAIDLNLESKNRSSTQFYSKPNSVDSGSMCRTPSDTTKNVTFNPQVISIEERPFESPRRKKWSFMSAKSRKECHSPSSRIDYTPKTILSSSSTTKRRNSDEFFTSRTEALPLLTNLASSSERTSPNFVQRKKYVYPSSTTITIVKGSESSV